MILNIPELKELSSEERGNGYFIRFLGNGPAMATGLQSLLNQLPKGSYISIADTPSMFERQRELRLAEDGFEKKNGGHGSAGTWTPCSGQEALDWLLPRLEASTADPSLGAACLKLTDALLPANS